MPIALYLAFMKTILVGLLPLCLLVFFNVRLIRAIRRSYALIGRQKLNNGDNVTTNNEIRSALLLIAVVTSFIMFQLPSFFTLVSHFIIVPKYGFSLFSHEFIMNYDAVSHCLWIINSSVNFLIYFVMGRRFRQILLRYLLCYSKQSTSSTSTAATWHFMTRQFLDRHFMDRQFLVLLALATLCQFQWSGNWQPRKCWSIVGHKFTVNDCCI